MHLTARSSFFPSISRAVEMVVAVRAGRCIVGRVVAGVNTRGRMVRDGERFQSCRPDGGCGSRARIGWLLPVSGSRRILGVGPAVFGRWVALSCRVISCVVSDLFESSPRGPDICAKMKWWVNVMIRYVYILYSLTGGLRREP